MNLAKQNSVLTAEYWLMILGTQLQAKFFLRCEGISPL